MKDDNSSRNREPHSAFIRFYLNGIFCAMHAFKNIWNILVWYADTVVCYNNSNLIWGIRYTNINFPFRRVFYSIVDNIYQGRFYFASIGSNGNGVGSDTGQFHLLFYNHEIKFGNYRSNHSSDVYVLIIKGWSTFIFNSREHLIDDIERIFYTF